MIMELTTRMTTQFVEITVDEIKTTIFSSSGREIEDVIENLLDVVTDLSSYTNNSIYEYLERFNQE